MKGRIRMAKPTNDYNYNQIKAVFEVECTFSMLQTHPLVALFNAIPEEDQKKILRSTAVNSLSAMLKNVNDGGSFAFLRSIK
jgi:hypothetical protein